MISRSETIKELNDVQKKLWELCETRNELLKTLDILNEIRFKDIIDSSLIHLVRVYLNSNSSIINRNLNELLPIENELNLHIEDLERYLAKSLFLKICDECDFKTEANISLLRLCGKLTKSIVPIIKVVPSNSGYNILPTYKIVKEKEFDYCVNRIRNCVESI